VAELQERRVEAVCHGSEHAGTGGGAQPLDFERTRSPTVAGMHAIRLHEFGPAENLRWEEVEDPVPGEGEVLVEVAASGVHLLDTSIRRGAAGGPFPLPDLPAIPGREVAGTVLAAGPGADPAWVGRRVVAHLGQASRGYAERVVTEAARLHGLPAGVDERTAVAMIGTGRTALGVLDVARPAAGDVVLVTGAAGGLGALLVQGALRAGAQVVGAAGGSEKAARVEALGARAVDYLRPDWAALVPHGVTLVLDGVGGAAGRAAFERLTPGGRIVLFGWSSGEPTRLSAEDLLARSLTASAGLGPHILTRLRELEERALAAAADGSLVPLLDDRFALSAAAAAHAALEARGTVGKVVLVRG
jgi:NADPH2:quinone reductase